MKFFTVLFPFTAAGILWALPAAAPADFAARIAGEIHNAALDPNECYRVRDVVIQREDVRIYLTDGYLAFATPVHGRRVAAFFTSDVEGGDGEILLMPPLRSERMALASFTKSPNLDEHVRTAILIFADDAAEELLAQIRERQKAVPDTPGLSPEMGALLGEKWNPVLRNLLSSFEVRLVEALIAERPAAQNFFYAAFASKRLGNFDFVYDPRAREQITVGQLAFRDDRAYFDVWCSFESRSVRKEGRPRAAPDFRIQNVHIDASLNARLELKALTRLRIVPTAEARVLPFDISPRITITEARIDGQEAEVFQHDSLRANLIRATENMVFLVIPAHPLLPGQPYEVEIRHEGQVVRETGDGVYFVGARSNWYPNRDMQFATYDIAFHYPKELDLVFMGNVIEDRIEGEQRYTRRRPPSPIRFAGFNLGRYVRATASHGGFTVEVYGNRQAEAHAPAAPSTVLVLPPEPPSWPSKRAGRQLPIVLLPEPPRPASVTPRMTELASEIASAMEFMASKFGPPAMKHLTVSPVPGSFGQGFAGLIYLSTLSYLPPPATPPLGVQRDQQLFFSEILHAHETAHQWWGNVVATADYQDDWLMEALASYSALLYLERRRGARVLDEILESYKTRLLANDAEGRTLESAGPITWSFRLQSSQTPRSWHVITYEKGAWIIHMLRRRMGDERFFAMLAELCRRYRFQTITTRMFRLLAAEFMPKDDPDPKLEAFFDRWVYGTGIPTLKLSYSVKGKAPLWKLTVSVTQTDVSEEFGTWVPVEIQFARSKPLVRWVETGGDPVTFTLELRQPPARVLLDPRGSVLARKL